MRNEEALHRGTLTVTDGTVQERREEEKKLEKKEVMKLNNRTFSC